MIITVFLSYISFVVTFSNSEIDNQQIENKKYLALGDSYTIGESIEYLERFPVQLVKKLKFSGINCAQPEIIAKTGWTTDELLEGIEKAEISKDYDLVSLLIGVNNQYRGRDLENYKEEFEVLLQKAIRLVGNKRDRVIVISIPDYGVTPFGLKKGRKKIATEIDAFNKAKVEISNEYGISYVNITEISRTAYRRPSLVADDGLHPSGDMYSLWVEEILPFAIEKLKVENAE